MDPITTKRSPVIQLMGETLAVETALEGVDRQPNKWPFNGILTRIGEPSPNAPTGTAGFRFQIPSAVARAALTSLEGMPLNAEENFAGHDISRPIGHINTATIVNRDDGEFVQVFGYLYDYNAAEVVTLIREAQSILGMSFEALARYRIDPIDADAEEPEYVAVAEELVFTGATILRKSAAAYGHETAIAASRQIKKETLLEPKELKDAIAAALGDLKIAEQIQTAADESVQKIKTAGDEAVDQIKSAAAVQAPPVEEAPAEKASEGLTAEALATAIAAANKPLYDALAAMGSTDSLGVPGRKTIGNSQVMAKFGLQEMTGDELTAAIDKLEMPAHDRIGLKLQARWNGAYPETPARIGNPLVQTGSQTA